MYCSSPALLFLNKVTTTIQCSETAMKQALLHHLSLLLLIIINIVIIIIIDIFFIYIAQWSVWNSSPVMKCSGITHRKLTVPLSPCAGDRHVLIKRDPVYSFNMRCKKWTLSNQIIWYSLKADAFLTLNCYWHAPFWNETQQWKCSF